MERRFATCFAISLFVLFLPATAWAQTGTIEGQVIDSENGEPLPGVSVRVQGERVGSATDANGQYVIEAAPTGEHVLEASFVGYTPQQETVVVQANETVAVSFELAPDQLGLDEVVVTGTGGEVEKGKLGNTISTINSEDLENNPITNVSELLQGREAGVQGIPGSGMTGQGSQIRIRGSASLSQNNEPVVYVDGIRANNGGGFSGFVGAGGSGTPSRLDDINPDAIQRVEILKGAAAATLFGSEASNGVIQIFTKRGEAGQDPTFNLSLEQSVIDPIDRRISDQFGFASTQAQADQLSQFFNGNEQVQPFELVSQTAIKDLMETGYSQTYSGSVEGGTETITYYASGRFTTEDGVLGIPDGLTGNASDEVTKGQGNVNVGIFPSESSRIRVTAQYSDQSFSTLANSNNIFGVLAAASGSDPIRVTEQQEYGTLFLSVEESLQQEFEQETQRFNGNVNANYRPLEPITLDATFGVDFTTTRNKEIRPFGWNVDGVTSFNTEGERTISDDKNLEFTLDVKGVLDNEFDIDSGFINEFTSSLTVGSQGFFSEETVTSITASDFPGPGFNVVSAAATFDRLEQFQEVRQVGVFTQEQVGINDHLFLTAGVRLDANSAFGDDFSTVTYPKASLSYVPSDAEYWPSSVGLLSSLRLRASVGQSGLQPGAFDALTTFGPFGSPDGAGVAPDNLGNENLKPEIATEYEVGTEMGFLRDRYTIEATYWDRTVEDALVARQFPPTGGFSSSQLVNIGKTKGRGVEIGVNATPINTQDVRLSLFGNASYLWEQVKDLGDAPPIKAGGTYPRVRNFVTEGFAPAAHFGAKLVSTPEGVLPVDLNRDGEPDTKEELETMLDGENPASDFLPANTTQVLLQQTGNELLSQPLNNYLGKPWPDWQGSFGFDLSYFNFTLSTMFEYKAGNYYVNNLDGAFRARNTAIGRNTPLSAKVTRDFRTGGVDENFTPQNSGEVRTEALETWLNELLGLAPFSGLNHIERADHIRWRELSLTYSVPTQVSSRLGVEDLSFTVSGRNLRLWTTAGYSGEDPETNELGRGTGDNFDENFRAGIEAWNVPLPRRFTFRLRARF